MKRLFVFGCSFTKYSWPTWADMLGVEFEQYENWGMPGLGNRAIAERIAECHVKNKFNKDDIVIVQWSSHIRHDWYKEAFDEEENCIEGWGISSSSPNFSKHRENFKKIYSEKAYIMHTLNMIVLTQSILKQTECIWLMTSIGDLRNLGYDNVFSFEPESVDSETSMLCNEINNNPNDWLIQKKFPEFNSYVDIIWNDNIDRWVEPIFKTILKNKENIWVFEKDNSIDLHPTPFMHNLWLNQNLKEKLNVEYNYNNKRNFIVECFEKLKAKDQYSQDEFVNLSESAEDKLIEKQILPENYRTRYGF
jgi:hypothetical protein